MDSAEQDQPNVRTTPLEEQVESGGHVNAGVGGLRPGMPDANPVDQNTEPNPDAETSPLEDQLESGGHVSGGVGGLRGKMPGGEGG
ncbi:MAG: hypothetical protein ACR2OB_14895 [Solirubrobacteraceae bacterium]